MKKNLVVFILMVVPLLTFAANITLTYVTWDGPERHIPYYNALRAIDAKFMKDNTNIKVVYQYIPAEDYGSKITTMTLSGQAPDLVFHDEWQASTYLLAGQIVDMTPYMKKYPDTIKGIYPSMLKFFQWNGLQYSIGEAHLPMVLWYRKDMFREAGLARPQKGWTWDQFRQYAQKLTKRDANGNITQYGFEGGLGPYVFGISEFGYSNGALPIDAKTKTVNLDIPAIKQVFDFMNTLQFQDKTVTRVGVALQGQVGAPYQTGRVAMVYTGSWMMGDPGYNDYEWGAAYMPVNKPGRLPLTSNVVGWFIHKGSKHPDEAYQLAAAFAAPYAQELLVKTGYASVRADINNNIAFKDSKLDDQDRAVLFDTMQNMNYTAGDVWRIPNMNKVIDEYLKTENLVLTQQKDTSLLTETANDIRALISQ